MNIITSNWLPVLRADGQRDIIAPWQISEPDLLRLDYYRPDLQCGMLEFLIGLVQTCYPPDDVNSLRRQEKRPPAPDELRHAMSQHAAAFELFGDGPCFMQDMDLQRGDTGKKSPVERLFMDSPGANAIKENTDFFIKRGRYQQLCPACAAAALFTLQAWAPSGGQGHNTSLRGGGPTSTLITGDTLWQSVWRNTLLVDSLINLANPESDNIFPWLRDSGNKLTPADVHPLHVYWAMPRRIRLLPQDNGRGTPCSLCGTISGTIITEYITLPRGNNYTGGFQHPLSPTAHIPNGPPYHIHGLVPTVGYQHWAGLIDTVTDKKRRREPALVVSSYRERTTRPFSVTVAGYDMVKATPQNFQFGQIPVYSNLSGPVLQMVEVATQLNSELRKILKEFLFSPGRKIPNDNTILNITSAQYWRETEPIFYEAVKNLREPSSEQNEVIDKWLRETCRIAYYQFRDIMRGEKFDANKAHYQGPAWQKALAFLRQSNNRWRRALGLPEWQREKKSPATR